MVAGMQPSSEHIDCENTALGHSRHLRAERNLMHDPTNQCEPDCIRSEVAEERLGLSTLQGRLWTDEDSSEQRKCGVGNRNSEPQGCSWVSAFRVVWTFAETYDAAEAAFSSSGLRAEEQSCRRSNVTPRRRKRPVGQRPLNAAISSSWRD